MEEKNELNDIILNKSGSGSSTKKLLLAIAALTLILIIVLVIMNSLKSQTDEPAPAAAVVPEPSAPTEVIEDPLFEPVEVIQEGSGNVTANEPQQDLGQIAQKIKQESFQNAPAEVQQQAAPVAPVQQVTPVPVKPAAQPKAAVQTAPAVVTAPKPAPVKAQPTPKEVQKAAQPVINTPTIKSTPKAEPLSTRTVTPAKPATKQTAAPVEKPAEKTTPKVVEKPVEKAVSKPAEKAAAAGSGTYYIQVGSFSKEPNKGLFDRINASGLKYVTSPNGSMTKVMIGPFQGEKAARDVLGTVKRNIESGAYITKG